MSIRKPTSVQRIPQKKEKRKRKRKRKPKPPASKLRQHPLVATPTQPLISAGQQPGGTPKASTISTGADESLKSSAQLQPCASSPAEPCKNWKSTARSTICNTTPATKRACYAILPDLADYCKWSGHRLPSSLGTDHSLSNHPNMIGEPMSFRSDPLLSHLKLTSSNQESPLRVSHCWNSQLLYY